MLSCDSQLMVMYATMRFTEFISNVNFFPHWALLPSLLHNVVVLAFCFINDDINIDMSSRFFAGEGVEVCEDLDEDCDFWSTSGECQKNPKFMLKKCRKSCGVCKGGK